MREGLWLASSDMIRKYKMCSVGECMHIIYYYVINLLYLKHVDTKFTAIHTCIVRLSIAIKVDFFFTYIFNCQ